MREPLPAPQPDPVIAAYRAGIDETLIIENLRLTVEERFQKWMELQRFADELRRAAGGARRLDLDKLIEVKRAAGRPKDLEAIAELEAIRDRARDRER